MKYLLAFASFVISACVLAISVSAQNPPTPSTPQSSAANKTWKDYSFPAGRFSVSLPGTPKEESQTTSTALGPLENHIITLETDEVIYMASYLDIPVSIADPDAIKKALDGGRDRALANIKGEKKLLSETEISIDGFAGRELRISLPNDILLRARFYLVKQRLYQILVLVSATEADAKDVIRFLDSFKLMSQATEKSKTPVTSPSSSAAPGAPKGMRVSPGVLQDLAIKKVQPTRPAGVDITGQVQVRILISERGEVIEAEIVSGHELLRDAALQAAKQWKFRSTEIAGTPVRVEGTLTFNFSRR